MRGIEVLHRKPAIHESIAVTPAAVFLEHSILLCNWHEPGARCTFRARRRTQTQATRHTDQDHRCFERYVRPMVHTHPPSTLQTRLKSYMIRPWHALNRRL